MLSEKREITEWQLKQVRSALEILARDPQAQLAYLDRLGTLPSLDELALEFDDARGTIPALVKAGAVPAELQEVAASIDAALAQMSREPDLWASDAIDGPQWRQIRTLGRRAFSLISEPRLTP